jgi:hypothetical protein
MADLRGLLTEARKENPLVVTGPHYRWLERPEEDRIYSDEALEFVVKALRGGFKHPRPGRFSASAIGGCERRMIFGFQGVPELPEDLDSPDLMGLGTWGHLRWQAEGITTGWIKEPEVWTLDRTMRVGGSIDALIFDDSVFELKTIHPFKYTKVTQVENEPLLPHALQTTVYELLEGVQFGSIVYEDRSSGNFYEFRHELNEGHAATVMSILARVNDHVESGTLPPMRVASEPCLSKAGPFKNCPFREHCPKMAHLAGEF